MLTPIGYIAPIFILVILIAVYRALMAGSASLKQWQYEKRNEKQNS